MSASSPNIKGYINSIQSLGAVDGPGVRFVVFLQGCPLRCIYCHNPETWDISKAAQSFTPEQLLEKVLRYKSYFGSKGGITLSGGEVLLQIEFATEMFRLCKEHGIHTALDTSGIGCEDSIKLNSLLEYTDLVICDVKFTTEEAYKNYTGGSLQKVLNFLDLVEEKTIPVWIRQVIVPNLNDDEKSMEELNSLIAKYSNIEKVELLPFKKLCLSKYENMGLDFRLKDTDEADPEKVKLLNERFK